MNETTISANSFANFDFFCIKLGVVKTSEFLKGSVVMQSSTIERSISERKGHLMKKKSDRIEIHQRRFVASVIPLGKFNLKTHTRRYN
jgi:hypothetical protein